MPSSPPVVFTPPSPSPAAPAEPGLAAAAPAAPPVVFAAPSPSPAAPPVPGLAAAAPGAPPVVFAHPMAASVAATDTATYSGDNNDMVFTAAAPGEWGNGISVINSRGASGAMASTVTVSGLTITVTRVPYARMVITGSAGPDVNGTLHYAGTESGVSYWSTTGAITAPASGTWIRAYTRPENSCVIERYVAGAYDGGFVSANNPATPDAGTGWLGGTTPPTVTAGYTCASQFLAALAADPSAAAIVTGAMASGNDGSGSILGSSGSTATSFLTGGSGPPLIPAAVLP
jgi:hypothetical protein